MFLGVETSFRSLRPLGGPAKSVVSKLWPFKGKTGNIKAIELLDMPDDEQSAWWGTFRVLEEQPRYSKMGGWVICIDRVVNEWHIACYVETDEDKMSTQNFNIRSSEEEIRLSPCLPDKGIWVPLDHPLFIPPQGEIALYASLPVWIRTEIGGEVICEIPTQILSDSWHGPNTLFGELCYASKLPASLHVEDLPRDTLHVLIPLSLINLGSEGIFIKDLNIDVSHKVFRRAQQNYFPFS